MIDLNIFSKEFIEVLIDETYRWLSQQEQTVQTERVHRDLVKAMYFHMSHWNITNPQARIAIKVLRMADIQTMKNIKSYNYNKLLIAYEHRKNKPTVPPVQDFYYERGELHEGKWTKIPGG